jgi:hypothetical protein
MSGLWEGWGGLNVHGSDNVMRCGAATAACGGRSAQARPALSSCSRADRGLHGPARMRPAVALGRGACLLACSAGVHRSIGRQQLATKTNRTHQGQQRLCAFHQAWLQREHCDWKLWRKGVRHHPTPSRTQHATANCVHACGGTDTLLCAGVVPCIVLSRGQGYYIWGQSTNNTLDQNQLD